MDIHNIELIGTGFSLVAEFLKAIKEREGAATAADYRKWLENDVFPVLLRESERTLDLAISLKANQHEQYKTLLKLLEDIHAAVIVPSARQRWHALSDVERHFLRHLYERSEQDPYTMLFGSELEASLGLPRPEVNVLSHYFEEKKLLKRDEHTLDWFVSPTAEGILFVWESLDDSFSECQRRQATCLLQAGGTGLRALATAADVPIARSCFQVQHWSELGQLSFQNNFGQWSAARINSVSESFRREWSATQVAAV